MSPVGGPGASAAPPEPLAWRRAARPDLGFDLDLDLGWDPGLGSDPCPDLGSG
ncbi:hypothetical protein [Streptomyces dioscori]|uniref:hypothetical protein n=1 Tax=Streptomyces dioscori TaxID=2109333 RepID=UPI00131C6F00|nr:hypothetical protein [Streptomyces dioscori]